MTNEYVANNTSYTLVYYSAKVNRVITQKLLRIKNWTIMKIYKGTNLKNIKL